MKMTIDLKPVHEYIKSIEKKLVTADATEHTHRAALGVLIESLASGIIADMLPEK